YVDVDADVGALGAEVVGRHHVIDQCLDKGRLLKIEEGVASGGRSWRGCGLLRLRGVWRRGPSGCRGATDHGALKEGATAPPLLVCGLLAWIVQALRVRAVLVRGLHRVLPGLVFCAPQTCRAAKCAFQRARARPPMRAAASGDPTGQ